MPRGIEDTVSGSAFQALAAQWLVAPAERSSSFFPAFSAISVEIQKTLRERIPAIYFANSEQFAKTRHAYPILVYMASRPYRPKSRTDFAYDVLNQTMMATFFRVVKSNLVAVLASVVVRLQAEGRNELVRFYQPHRAPEVIASVQRRSTSTNLLYDLLVGESALVNELLQMAGFGDHPPREQAKRSATLFRNWDFHLRRMCTGHDLRYLGPALFEVATAALRTQQQNPREPEHSPQATGEEGESSVNEADGAECLGGFALFKVRDDGLLMAVDESDAIGRVDELESLPE